MRTTYFFRVTFQLYFVKSLLWFGSNGFFLCCVRFIGSKFSWWIGATSPNCLFPSSRLLSAFICPFCNDTWNMQRQIFSIKLCRFRLISFFNDTMIAQRRLQHGTTRTGRWWRGEWMPLKKLSQLGVASFQHGQNLWMRPTIHCEWPNKRNLLERKTSREAECCHVSTVIRTKF